MTEAPKLVAIYGLYDPRTDALRYIGKASDPLDRWRRHCKPGHSAMRFPVARWAAELAGLGLRPRMEVLTWCRAWEVSERRLIAAYRKAGADLLNVASGGVDIPRHLRSTRPHIATAKLWWRAIQEINRAWRVSRDDGAYAAYAIEHWINNLRAVRRKLLRHGEMRRIFLFDVNVWAHLSLKEPLDWDVSDWSPVQDRSPSYRQPILDAASRIIGIPVVG